MKPGWTTTEFWMTFLSWGVTFAVNKGWLSTGGGTDDIIKGLATLVSCILTAYYMKGRVDLKKNGGSNPAPPQGG